MTCVGRATAPVPLPQSCAVDGRVPGRSGSAPVIPPPGNCGTMTPGPPPPLGLPIPSLDPEPQSTTPAATVGKAQRTTSARDTVRSLMGDLHFDDCEITN